MLYRLSYSLTEYPTEATDPGNVVMEPPGMQFGSCSSMIPPLLVSVVALVGTARGAATPGAAEADVGSGSTARPEPRPEPVVVEPADDGEVLLSGSVATIRGTTLRWEPEPHKLTLGFWTRVDDAAEWRFAVGTVGEFDVEILQGCGTGQGGSEMVVILDPGADAPSTVTFTVEDTGGFQAFRRRTVGRLSIAAAGEHVLRIKPERIAKQAACDIRQVRLVPAKLVPVKLDPDKPTTPKP